MSIKERIRKLALNYHPEVVANRRHMHAHPELSFEETETSAFIQDQLKELGVPFENGLAENGVAALIKGGKSGPTIALRADFDALPITEANDVPYKSTKPGVMHACGHDAHTANLLGVVKILNEIKSDLPGQVKCIFQPAEERFPGGASLMIKDGVLENPSPTSIIGQHVHPPLDAGTIGFCSGLAMASADEIYMTISGKGGHAAAPTTFIDPVLITAHVITALQQVISRRANPLIPSVLSFGKINSTGGATNIIPSEVKLEGTFRTLDETWRFEAHEKIKKIATQVAEAMDGTCEVDVRVGYPFLFNDEALTARNKAAAIEFLGEERVQDIPIRMGAEDFAYYSQQMPGCFYRLGIRNEAKGITSGLHTPTFNIDESALETGVGLMAWLAYKELEHLAGA